MRTATITRATKETDIAVVLHLDGGGASISTGIGFFDHMLTALAAHGRMGLELACRGDLHVDMHHTVEDVGIALGQAFCAALGDKSGIARFGSAYVPMDESLAFACADISGRPFLFYDDGGLSQLAMQNFDAALIAEFMRAFAYNAGITLQLEIKRGGNAHHMAEALFKALARALRAAVVIEGGGIPSTKGVL